MSLGSCAVTKKPGGHRSARKELIDLWEPFGATHALTQASCLGDRREKKGGHAVRLEELDSAGKVYGLPALAGDETMTVFGAVGAFPAAAGLVTR